MIFSGIKNDTLPENSQFNIVVYGNTVYPNGDLSNRLEARLDHVIALYESQNIETIIVSGGIGDEGVDEAIAMGKYLEEEGVLKNRIIIDSNGYTTKLTSMNAKNFIKEDAIGTIGVSQWFHIPRVLLSLRKEGFKNIYGSAPKFFEARDVYSFIRELVAYLKYML